MRVDTLVIPAANSLLVPPTAFSQDSTRNFPDHANATTPSPLMCLPYPLHPLRHGSKRRKVLVLRWPRTVESLRTFRGEQLDVLKIYVRCAARQCIPRRTVARNLWCQEMHHSCSETAVVIDFAGIRVEAWNGRHGSMQVTFHNTSITHASLVVLVGLATMSSGHMQKGDANDSSRRRDDNVAYPEEPFTQSHTRSAGNNIHPETSEDGSKTRGFTAYSPNCIACRAKR